MCEGANRKEGWVLFCSLVPGLSGRILKDVLSLCVAVIKLDC